MIDEILLKANQEGTLLKRYLKENELGILILTKNRKTISDFIEIMTDICHSKIEYGAITGSLKNDRIGISLNTVTSKDFEEIADKTDKIEGLKKFSWADKLVITLDLPDKHSVFIKIEKEKKS
jgi:hypothetical protein